nr:prepilin peptidase [Vibrio sp. Isolate33]
MILYLTILLTVCACCSLIDIKFRIIKMVALLLILFIQVYLLSLGGCLYFSTTSIVLLAGVIVYSFRLLGGGDIKYAAVLSLSLPMELLPSALLLTMLAGGVLASFYLLFNFVRRIKANVNGGVDDSQYNAGIPYGVAISVGFYVMIFSHWVNYI